MNVGFVGNVPPPVGGAEVFLQRFLTSFTSHHRHTGTLVRWRRQRFQFFPEHVTRIYAPHGTIKRSRDLTTHYLFEAQERNRFEKRSRYQDRIISIYSKQAEDTAQIFSRAKVRLIQTHMLFPNLLFGAIAAKALSVPLVLTIHGMLEFRILDHVRERYAQLAHLVESNLSQVTMVVAVSEEIATECRKRGVLRVKQLPCGVDTDFFVPSGNQSKQTRDVVFVGTVRKDKGALLLIRSFERISEAVPGKLIFIGQRLISGPIYERAKRNQRVQFLGVLSAAAIRQRLQRAKLVVLPSESEGLPLSILEAMACEKPVLVSCTGELPKLIRNGKNGFLITQRNVTGLADQMKQVLARGDLQKIGARARRTAVAFNINRTIKGYETIYHSLI